MFIDEDYFTNEPPPSLDCRKVKRNKQLLMHYELQGLNYVNCAGIALFTVISSECICHYAIQVIRIWRLAYNAHGYKNIIHCSKVALFRDIAF